jgi:hypothetical protein
MQAAVVDAIHGSVALFSLQLLIGFGCSALGGYIAARIAKHDELLNGAIASWLCVAIGIYSLTTGHATGSIATHVGMIALTPVCYLLGAYLRLRAVRARAAKR